ncbi:MAG: hypothetical protein WC503_02725 [Candidatus Shapirobacteria bacterium]
MSKRGIENSIRMFVAGAIVAGTVGCANATPNPDKETYTPTPITSPSNTIIPPFDETPTVETQNWTETVIATAIPTETATPEAGIDMEMFHNLPQSYEYLLAHPDEFIQAPDPLTDRAAFDKWWNEEFIPALGPVSERPLTANTLNMIDSRFSYSADADVRPIPLIGQPSFFWFESIVDGSRVVYPVPCVNITNSSFPGITKQTLCAALSDLIPSSRAGTNSLEMFGTGAEFVSTEVYQDLSYRSDVDWGGLDNLINSLGGFYNDPDNSVIFGFGRIIFDKNY